MKNFINGIIGCCAVIGTVVCPILVMIQEHSFNFFFFFVLIVICGIAFKVAAAIAVGILELLSETFKTLFKGEYDVFLLLVGMCLIVAWIGYSIADYLM